VATRSVIAELRMVPNQPLTFLGETQQRSEDAIIAYSWDKYLRTGDEAWPLRLPMTKSVVRAMDTVTAFCRSAAGGGIDVDRFVVGGASKRGWTAWTAAAVDRRVVAVAPVVIDLLTSRSPSNTTTAPTASGRRRSRPIRHPVLCAGQERPSSPRY